MEKEGLAGKVAGLRAGFEPDPESAATSPGTLGKSTVFHGGYKQCRFVCVFG